MGQQPYDIPHLAYPIRFAGGYYATHQQGSMDAVITCVRNICAFEVGSRIERPDFGIPDPTLKVQPIDIGAIADAIAKWDPRVTAEIEVDLDASGIETLDITISLPYSEES